MAGPIIRLKALVSHTGLSRSAIYDRMDVTSPRYAKDFPKPFSLGGGAVGWFMEEVDAWLQTCSTNAKPGKGKRPKMAPPASAIPVHQVPLPIALDYSAKQQQKASREGAHPSRLTNAQMRSRKGPQPRNLAEAIIEGGQLNNRMLHFLKLKKWTPAMGALLIAGIDAPHDCNAISDDGIGLDQQLLDKSNIRFVEAHRILREWHNWQEDVNDQSSEIEPVKFLNWCLRDEIDTEWLRLFLELIGFSDEKSVDLTASRFALLISR